MRPLALALALTLAQPALASSLRPPVGLPGVDAGPPVERVQSGDAAYRVQELEEQVRQLNGKVEELSFQLLQMQEQLRRMQEDNELRFQELEDRRSDASGSSGGGGDRLGKPQAPGADAPGADTTGTDTGDGDTAAAAPKDGDVTKGDEPRALGTLTLDADGNVVGAEPSDDAAADDLSAPTAADAAQFGDGADAVRAAALAAYEARDYRRAERALGAHIAAFPDDPSTAQIRYWRGQSLFWLKRYDEAAELQLETHKAFITADTAPDNLLGLGLSLAGLNQREVACATLGEILLRYPDAEERLGPRIADEQAALKC